MYSAIDIADLFASRGIEMGKPVTQMQLQKMVYFANGILLAYTEGEERLVNEKFQAWEFGPVIPEIYHAYKQFGAGPIEPDNDFLKLVGKQKEFKQIELSSELHQEVINETWEALKDISGIQLSNWTHKEGSAWHRVYKPEIRSIELNEADIINDFKPFLKKRATSEAR